MPRSVIGSTFRPSSRLLPLLLLFGLATPASAQQSAVVRSEENIRAEPNGQIIGRALPGTRLTVEGREDRWVQVTFEGWVWLPSLRSRSGGSFNLTVSAADGENLRDEPRGRIAARLDPGTLLVEEERITGWARVKRTAWIWGPSVAIQQPDPTPVAAASPSAPRAAAPPPAESRWIRGGPAGSPILSAPDGDTLARSAAGAELRVVGREGNWARVQVDGWVWSPEGADASSRPGGTDPASVEAVSSDPARYRGRVVSWTLQFIALERAERVRTDFFQGEPYLLTRAGSGEGMFVYVAVPPERMADIQGLTPLERVQVVGRVRTGAAELTGSPILDLVEIRRVGR
jgi:hypothetical protein